MKRSCKNCKYYICILLAMLNPSEDIAEWCDKYERKDKEHQDE